MITIAIKPGNLHPIWLCNEPRFCGWFSSCVIVLLWLCFRGGYCPSVYVRSR